MHFLNKSTILKLTAISEKLQSWYENLIYFQDLLSNSLTGGHHTLQDEDSAYEDIDHQITSKLFWVLTSTVHLQSNLCWVFESSWNPRLAFKDNKHTECQKIRNVSSTSIFWPKNKPHIIVKKSIILNQYLFLNKLLASHSTYRF